MSLLVTCNLSSIRLLRAHPRIQLRLRRTDFEGLGIPVDLVALRTSHVVLKIRVLNLRWVFLLIVFKTRILVVIVLVVEPSLLELEISQLFLLKHGLGFFEFLLFQLLLLNLELHDLGVEG